MRMVKLHFHIVRLELMLLLYKNLFKTMNINERPAMTPSIELGYFILNQAASIPPNFY